MFAASLGVPFRLPEEIFPLPAARMRPCPSQDLELVLMIGYPGSGKSTLAGHWAEKNADVLHLEMDEFKTTAKAQKAALEAPQKTWIVDATHGTKSKRAEWIQWAAAQGRGVRAAWVDVSIDEALQRNAQRAFLDGRPVPKVALCTFRKNFQPPEVEEGFLEVHHF